MAIPESQLDRWSHQGAVTTTKQTHESVRAALRQYRNWPTGIDHEVYLQGSYKNDTNIRADSDVDVVIQLTSAFHSNLTEEQKRVFGFTQAAYGWDHFRGDVLQALGSHYGYLKVQEGRKSLKIETPYLPADVVVCIQYREYNQPPRSITDFVEGMTFCVRAEARWVVNYPKLHYENGVRKNDESATNGLYKPTVRLFKNARTYLIHHRVIPADLGPSYFLECLLYNVPDSRYSGDLQDIFCNVVNHLLQGDFTKFVCQSEQLYLFGNSPEQWSEGKARSFVQSMADLWNKWA